MLLVTGFVFDAFFNIFLGVALHPLQEGRRDPLLGHLASHWHINSHHRAFIEWCALIFCCLSFKHNTIIVVIESVWEPPEKYVTITEQNKVELPGSSEADNSETIHDSDKYTSDTDKPSDNLQPETPDSTEAVSESITIVTVSNSYLG